MPPILRLYEDVLSNDATGVRLPALARMIFIVHGAVTIDGHTFSDGEAWHGESAATLDPREAGATCWRFELAPSGAGDGAAAGQGCHRVQRCLPRSKPFRRVICSCAATALPFRPAAAPTCIGIKGPASAA
jgi:hypothetical protein